MRVVYYLLPTTIGENVVVSERLFTRESEIAAVVDEGDKGKPYFDFTLTEVEDGVEVEATPTELEEGEANHPYFMITEDGLQGSFPFRDELDARTFAKFLYEKVVELEELQDE